MQVVFRDSLVGFSFLGFVNQLFKFGALVFSHHYCGAALKTAGDVLELL